MTRAAEHTSIDQRVRIPLGRALLEGNLCLPDNPAGVVLFAHGSGSGRHSPRNRFVAKQLREAGLGTLLLDLLTEQEELADARTGHLRFNIGLLAQRLVGAADWVEHEPHTAGLPLGYFGASTGGGAALVAAAALPHLVKAVVSRGGRPDLAGAALTEVRAPTLLLVGGEDRTVLKLNEGALAKLAAPVKRLTVIPGAGHLFEEPGKLEEVARLAAEWFTRHLAQAAG